MCAGENVDRPGPVVRGDWRLVRFGERGNLLRLGDAAGPDQVRHHDFGRAPFDELAEVVLADEALGRADGRFGGVGKPQMGLHIDRPYHLLLPEDVVLLHGLDDPDRARQRPCPAAIVCDLDLVAQGVPYLLQRLQRGSKVFVSEIVAAMRPSGREHVVRLHHGDAFVQVAPSEPHRVPDLPLVVLVRAVAANGVVGLDLVPALTAQHVVDRLSGRLPGQVPERNVNGGQRPELGACIAEALGQAVHLGPQGLAVHRVPAHKHRGERLMYDGGHGTREVPRLAKPGHAAIRVNLHPQDVEELLDSYGFDFRDLHDTSPIRVPRARAAAGGRQRCVTVLRGARPIAADGTSVRPTGHYGRQRITESEATESG